LPIAVAEDAEVRELERRWSTHSRETFKTEADGMNILSAQIAMRLVECLLPRGWIHVVGQKRHMI